MNRCEIHPGVTVVDRYHYTLITPIVGAVYLWFRHPQDGWRVSPRTRARRDVGVICVAWEHHLDEVDDVDDVDQNPVMALIREPIPGSVTGRVDVAGATDRIEQVAEALRSAPFDGSVAIGVPSNMITVSDAVGYRADADRQRSREDVEQARLIEIAERQVDQILDVVEGRYEFEVSDPVRDAMVRQASQVGQISLPLTVLVDMCADVEAATKKT